MAIVNHRRSQLHILVLGLLLSGLLVAAITPAAAQLQCAQSAPACNGACPPGKSCVGGAAGGCQCVAGFPPAGTDLSPTVGIFRVDDVSVGTQDAKVSGQLLLQWSNPFINPATGKRTVQTQILSMDLVGSDPVLGSLNVRAGTQFGLPPTLGQVTQINPGSDFPAAAFFDVFFEVTVDGVTALRNDQPLVMQAEITQIPPRSVTLKNAAPVPIRDVANPSYVDTLQVSGHWMCPPPFPPTGQPCPVPCGASPFPVCSAGACPPGLQCVPVTLGVCQCVPGFPPAGTDLSPTTGIFHVDATGVGGVDTSVAGQTLLQWQNPQTDPATGQRTVQTEMLSMDLTGAHPALGTLSVQAGSQHGLPATLGSVVPLGDTDFPANAFFDVFFEVEVSGVVTLRNDQPLVMQAEITEIPPRDIGLRNAGAILITDVADPTHVDVLQTALHWMCPPPFPPAGTPCPVPCGQSPFPVCSPGDCPKTCSGSGVTCQGAADCPAGETCDALQCVPGPQGVCECKPGFPPAGTDLSPTVGTLRVDVIGLGPQDVNLSGQTLLQFSSPQTDPTTGQRTVQTEILSLDLAGSHPSIGSLNVTAGTQQGLPPTLGSVTPNQPGADFPANAFFDVFFEVEVEGVATLRNEEPLVMQADITEIPPRAIGLRNAAPVQITDVVDPQHVDTIQTAQHWMCPPPFPPSGPCPVPCGQNPFPVCAFGACPPDKPKCAPSPANQQCVCVGGFPPAGTDLSPTVGALRVDVLGLGPQDVNVSGQTLLKFSGPQTDPMTGQRTVQTEILSLQLTGSQPSIGSLNVTAGTQQGLPPTLGSVVPVGPGSDFPANAFFDVFFEVEVEGVATLRNDEPLVMQAEIDEIPPRAIGLRNAAPVQITDIANPQHVDTIQTAQHWMCPPPFPPPGVPCPVPCDRNPFPVCAFGACPPDRPLCVADAALGACRCVKPFPPAGFDLSPTTGLVAVDVIGVGPTEVAVAGETLLKWQNPQTDPTTGQRTVQTEMLSLDLAGSHPSIGNLNVRAGTNQGLPPTLGSVTPVSPGGPEFPANAFFDVFFEVEVEGVATLRNDQPLVMQAEIVEIPPRNLGLQNLAPVQITDVADPQHVDTIQTAVHWMCPPPFPPPGVPCPVPCDRSPFPLCGPASCPPGLQCVPLAIGVCQCVPGFPPAGTDLSPTTGIFHVDATGVGGVDTSVAGQTLLQWQNPQTDPATGQRTVQTELLSMDLSGAHPALGTLNIKAGSQHGLPATLGSVVPLTPNGDFPAAAFFDVFFEVEVQGVAVLRNSEPLVMQAQITEIPPRDIGLRNAAPVLITDVADPTHVDVLQTAQHWMCPPPFPPPGVPCPVPCDRAPFPVCSPGSCPGFCSGSGAACQGAADCPAGDTCIAPQCVPGPQGVCECKLGFPPAGTDLSPTVGALSVDVIGLGPQDVNVSGQTLLQFSGPQTDPTTGQRTVQTEMLSLQLTGSHPSIGSLNVRAGSQQGLPPTLGSVTPNQPGADFPANAFFDVFFEVEVEGVATLRNDEPLVMQADITEIPPRAIGLRNAAPVQITDVVDPQHVDTIQTAQHWMCPPPFPPSGPCPVPCGQNPFPVCAFGACPPDKPKCAPSPANQQCVCVGGFPPAGTDLSPTVGALRVDVLGLGPQDVNVSGQTLLKFSGPQTDPTTGQRTVQTEILSLQLTGSHPSIGSLNVTAGTQQGLPPTLGSVVPVGPGSDFPANAFFDVFFEVEVNGTTTLRNDEPLVMQAEIDEIPPRAIGLRNAAPVQITDIANPQHVDTIQTAQHWMCPPPFPPPGVPCPVPCDRNPFPVCAFGACPPDRPLCVADAALGACRCVKPFPPAGFDLSPTSGQVLVDVIGVGPTHVAVAGETLLKFSDPQTDPSTGQRSVQTELLSLDLSGANPAIGNLNVRAGTNQGLPPTLGSVTPNQPGADFPATAFFDVFFEVEVEGVATLRNEEPLVMQADITEIPPRAIGLRNAAPVQITDVVDPQHVDTIQTSQHWMCPPPFPPPGVPCPVPCSATPLPLCDLGACPPGLTCKLGAAACACVAPPPPTAGAIPDSAPGNPLMLSKATTFAAGQEITLTWGASCLPTDADYSVYDGEISNFYSHDALFCSTSGATSITFRPAAGSRYYLVVPHQGTVEGSYGTDSDGNQRPQGTPACRPQAVGPCP